MEGRANPKQGEDNDIFLFNKERHETEHPFGEPGPQLQLHLSSCTPSMGMSIDSILLEALPFGSRPRRHCFASRRPRTVHFLFGLDQLIQPGWKVSHARRSLLASATARSCPLQCIWSSFCFCVLIGSRYSSQLRPWATRSSMMPLQCCVGLQSMHAHTSVKFFSSGGGRVTRSLLAVTSRVFPIKSISLQESNSCI
jgi:hypothetical protein